MSIDDFFDPDMQEPPSKKPILIGVGGVLLIVALVVELKWHPATNWLRTQDLRWTGLFEYTVKRTTEKDPQRPAITEVTEEIQTGKTGWDYLQLVGGVAVPLVLGFGGFWLNQEAKRRLEARAIQDQNRADENLREESVQTYVDRISELLLNHNLGEPKQETNLAQDIALARTLTVLERLGKDGDRKAAILQFLYKAELLKQPHPVVKLHDADLSGVNLYKANLSMADLSGANLSMANLESANLSGVNLSEANLTNANLHYANLSNANLSVTEALGADLYNANLSGADLSRTQVFGHSLNFVHLIAVDFSKTFLSMFNLNLAIYDDSTSFPDGFDPEKAKMQKVD